MTTFEWEDPRWMAVVILKRLLEVPFSYFHTLSENVLVSEVTVEEPARRRTSACHGHFITGQKWRGSSMCSSCIHVQDRQRLQLTDHVWGWFQSRNHSHTQGLWGIESRGLPSYTSSPHPSHSMELASVKKWSFRFKRERRRMECHSQSPMWDRTGRPVPFRLVQGQARAITLVLQSASVPPKLFLLRPIEGLEQIVDVNTHTLQSGVNDSLPFQAIATIWSFDHENLDKLRAWESWRLPTTNHPWMPGASVNIIPDRICLELLN
jgi:hypothetical protein